MSRLIKRTLCGIALTLDGTTFAQESLGDNATANAKSAGEFVAVLFALSMLLLARRLEVCSRSAGGSPRFLASSYLVSF